MRPLITILLLCLPSQVAFSQLHFSVTPTNRKVVQGDLIVFEIRVSFLPTLIQRSRSSPPAVFSQIVSQIAVNGIDFQAMAGIGNGTQGVFVSGVNNQTFLFEQRPPTTDEPPGQAFSTNGQSGNSVIFQATPQLYARLTLDTTNVPVGQYSLTLNQLAANSPTEVIPPDPVLGGDSIFIGNVPTLTNAVGMGVVYTVLPAAQVEARSVFYNNSTGANISSIGTAQNAIATDKGVLRVPGSISNFSNYTNYSRGLNGIIVDVAGLPSSSTANDILNSLQFAQWNGIASTGFQPISSAANPSVTLFPDQGLNNSTRVKIVLADEMVKNTWLRVTLVSNPQTRIATHDTFYLGHVLADVNVGNTPLRYRVNADDVSAIRANQSGFPNTATITNPYDLNRDGRVNADDVSIVRANQQGFGIVAPLTVP